MFSDGKVVWHTPQPEYVSIQVFMRSHDVTKTDDVKEEELRLELCKENSYRETAPEQDRVYIDTGLCILDEDYEKANLYASPESPQSTIFEIRVSRCHGKPTCKSETEIQEYLKDNIFIISSA